MIDLHKDLTRVCGDDIPLVVCGNKVDAKERKVNKSNNPTFARKKGLRHFDISTKTGHNFEKPLLHLTRALMEDNRLRFVSTTTANDGSQKANVKQSSKEESDFASATSRLSLADEAKSVPLPALKDEEDL